MGSTVTDRIAGLSTSVAVKAPVQAIATAGISLAGLGAQAGGGWASDLEAGDRVLVIGQADARENGIYTAATSEWRRSLDFNGRRDVVQGTIVPLASNGDRYRVTSEDPIIIGASDISFQVHPNDDRVIRVGSVPEIESYSAPAGYVFSLNDGGRSGVFDVVAGDFSAELAVDTFNGIYIGLSDDPAANTKVAKRRTSQTVTPRCFGAVDGALAQEEIIEAFFAWAGRQGSEYRMAHDGDYYVSRGVRIESCSNAQFASGSNLIIRPPAGVYIDETGLRLYSCDNGNWGRLQVLGDSGGGGFRNGILGTRVRRGRFAGWGATYTRLFAAVPTSVAQDDDIPESPNNSNGAIIDKIDATYCGNHEGFDIAFSESARNYSAANPAQTSTLSVDLDDYYPTPARGTPFIYNGDAFVVLSYDSSAQEATVFPCMAADPDPFVSGTLTLLPGGGLCTNGGDAGQLRTEQVNVRFSSVGVMLQSAYGGTIKGLTSQVNGIDVVHGRPPDSFSNSGETILGIYSEQKEYLNVLSLTNDSSFIDILGSIEAFEQNQVLAPLPSPRELRGDGPVRILGSTGEAGTRLFHGVPRVTTWRRGTPGQSNGIAGDQDNAMAWPGGTIILAPDSASRDYAFNLGVDNVNTQAFGDSGFELVGLNFAAGNEITLTAPSGETVGGSPSVTYGGLPASFHIFCGRVGTTTWETHIVELSSASSYIIP